MSSEVNADFTSQGVQQNLQATVVNKNTNNNTTNNSQNTDSNNNSAVIDETGSYQQLQNFTLEDMQREISILQSTGAGVEDIQTSVNNISQQLSQNSDGSLNDTQKESIKSQIEELSNQIDAKLNTYGMDKVRDSNTAQQTLDLTKSQILQNPSLSLSTQANQSPAIASILI